MNPVDKVISAAIESYNQTCQDGQQLTNDANIVLFGPGSKIDSLGFVNFIVAIEAEVENQMNHSIILVDDQALNMEENPFRTMASLKTLVTNRLKTLGAL